MRISSPVSEGQTIAQKYRVERVLGEGGMGLVVAAWHLGLHQRVAIKFLLESIAREHEGAAERFRREAQAAAGIRSEHVCRVLDVGTLEDGIPFMVMEYLEGRDLSSELSERGSVPALEMVGYVLQACEALAEAHLAGIVHRDIKPANLFLAKRPDGSRAIKVLDFGVSKSLTDSGISQLKLTKTASVVGSPIYMSPEQLESSKDVDARADIWSLGAIMYELLTGRAPFGGDTMPQLVSAVLHTEPPALRDLEVKVPAGLEEVVLRALSKKRADRYASVAELAQALSPYAPAESAVSVARVVRVLAPVAGELATRTAAEAAKRAGDEAASHAGAESGERPRDPPQQAAKRRAWAIPAIALLALGGVGLWLLAKGAGDQRAPRKSSAAAAAATKPDAAVATAREAPQPAAVAPQAAAPAAVPPAVMAPTAQIADSVPESGRKGNLQPQEPPPSPAIMALPKGIDTPSHALPTAPEPQSPERQHTSSSRRPRNQAPATGLSDFGGRR